VCPGVWRTSSRAVPKRISSPSVRGRLPGSPARTRVGGMEAHREGEGAAHGGGGSEVVVVAVGEKNGLDRRAGGGFQDALGLIGRIDQHCPPVAGQAATYTLLSMGPATSDLTRRPPSPAVRRLCTAPPRAG